MVFISSEANTTATLTNPLKDILYDILSCYACYFSSDLSSSRALSKMMLRLFLQSCVLCSLENVRCSGKIFGGNAFDANDSVITKLNIASCSILGRYLRGQCKFQETSSLICEGMFLYKTLIIIIRRRRRRRRIVIVIIITV